ncbi:SDR family NAD(P)-dependent oxidoreductase [Nonomuraea turcica]|uniref:SDR family NAD(P)-dependent oxidoreductase n=1 Tax=Nonomuraea sp. G32 TaxID=3067274 RepID=UPI00273B8EE9|nr:SDR family NAD(P)-dependent oxidoreductase [Nonomuraea sp. G32]MDP4510124.1 SDR family NAD(P)-dependent oxidoreductase [Nonomuraea sp. G32]
MDSLSGQTVFITGGAQGIGLGMARAFAREGANVAIADVDRDALDQAGAQLSALSSADAIGVFELDVCDRTGFESTAEEVERRLGPVSVVCNNAGIRLPDSLPKLGYRLWDLVLGVNLGGVVNGVQTFLPRMIERGAAGHIVNVSSAAGLATHPNSTQAGSSGITYRTSKSAVIALSEALHFDLRAAGHPIGVTVLCPDLVSTKISTNSAVRGNLPPEERQLAGQGDATLARHGLHADTVGTIVIAAIQANQLYAHTDRTMIDAVTARNADILDAMPS